MATPNRSCKSCGVPYHVCKTCEESHVFMWKQVACSSACFQRYMLRMDGEPKGQEKKEVTIKVKYLMRAKCNGTVHDVTKYEMKDKGITALVTSENKSIPFDEVEYLIVPKETMATLLEAAYNNGGKRKKAAPAKPLMVEQ